MTQGNMVEDSRDEIRLDDGDNFLGPPYFNLLSLALRVIVINDFRHLQIDWVILAAIFSELIAVLLTNV